MNSARPHYPPAACQKQSAIGLNPKEVAGVPRAIRSVPASRLAEQAQLLANAAYEARLGTGHMTLADWIDVEQELKQKLKNEHLHPKASSNPARNTYKRCARLQTARGRRGLVPGR